MKIEEMMELISEANEMSSQSLDEIKEKHNNKNINSYDLKSLSSEHLCTFIASNRHLKISSQMELLCMRELAERRTNGDDYPFENKIDDCLKQFSPIETNVSEIFSMFSGVLGGSGKI